ncbi:hypothetical protein AWW70_09785 [Bacillus mycoides]|uniref:Uncharacterized protein n=1 Tax=Bacillus mycoides TaxID=1405 RepID=A0A109GEV4_BACMY|nr:hypothetical protein AWW70_09785 [Bacillus mycoides]
MEMASKSSRRVLKHSKKNCTKGSEISSAVLFLTTIISSEVCRYYRDIETMNTCQAIYDFTTLAIENGAIKETDRIYMHNQLIRLIGESEIGGITSLVETDPHVLLDTLINLTKILVSV